MTYSLDTLRVCENGSPTGEAKIGFRARGPVGVCGAGELIKIIAPRAAKFSGA